MKKLYELTLKDVHEHLRAQLSAAIARQEPITLSCFAWHNDLLAWPMHQLRQAGFTIARRETHDTSLFITMNPPHNYQI